MAHHDSSPISILQNQKSHAEIKQLWDKKDLETLRARMCGTLKFGTAGQ